MKISHWGTFKSGGLQAKVTGWNAAVFDTSPHRVHIFLEMNSAGAYTATLLVMINVIKGGGRAPPTLTSQANFTLMTECRPESSGCNSVYSVPPPIRKQEQERRLAGNSAAELKGGD